MEEIYKDIEGFESYQISNLGNVKSLKFGKERILKPSNRRDYISVTLHNKKILKNSSIHRLVAIAFIPNPYNKPFINHLDGNKQNNNISNLEWCTQSENIQHSYNTGLNKGGMFGKKGKENNNSKIIYQYTKDNILIKKWFSLSDVERELNYSNSHLASVANGKRKSAYGFIWSYEIR